MNALITKEYQGTPFVFREDGYFNMTKAAQAFGKFLPDFLRSTSVIEYMDALSKTGKFPDLIESRRGNGGGTWAHPKLAGSVGVGVQDRGTVRPEKTAASAWGSRSTDRAEAQRPTGFHAVHA